MKLKFLSLFFLFCLTGCQGHVSKPSALDTAGVYDGEWLISIGISDSRQTKGRQRYSCPTFEASSKAEVVKGNFLLHLKEGSQLATSSVSSDGQLFYSQEWGVMGLSGHRGRNEASSYLVLKGNIIGDKGAGTLHIGMSDEGDGCMGQFTMQKIGSLGDK